MYIYIYDHIYIYNVYIYKYVKIFVCSTRLLCLLAGLLVVLAYSGLHQSEAPNVRFTTIEGNTFDMASLKGKVVLVNFWATDCKSCIEEMPDLVKTYHTYASQGLEIIAVAMPYDPPAQVVNFADQKNLPFPVMHAGFGDITHQFDGVSVTPTTYIYNKEGLRIQSVVGTLNFDKLHALLNQELG